MITIALVNFRAEKKRFVVDVSTIKDFKPRSKDDFLPHQNYEVRWPILRRQESSQSPRDEYFNCNILLLASSRESLIAQAKKLHIRMPIGYVKEGTVQPVKTSNVDRKVRKKARLAKEKSTKERMEKILSVNKGGNAIPNKAMSASKHVLPPEKGRAESLSSVDSPKPEMKRDRSESPVSSARKAKRTDSPLKAQSPVAGSKRVRLDYHDKSSSPAGLVKNKNTTLMSPLAKSLSTTISVKSNPTDNEVAFSPSKQLKRGRPSFVRHIDFGGGPLISRYLDDCQEHGGAENSLSKPIKSPTRIDSDTEVSDNSYASSGQIIAALESKVISIQAKLNQNMKEKRVLSTEVQSLKLKFTEMKKAWKEITERMNAIFSEDDEAGNVAQEKESESCSLIVKPFKGKSPLKSPSKRKSPLKSFKKRSPLKSPLKKKSPLKSPLNRKSPLKSSLKREKFTLISSPEAHCVPTEKLKKSRSPNSKSSPMKTKNSKYDSNIQGHKVLGPIIYSALEGQTPLVKDGQGKVHLGNGLWLREAHWAKISTSSKKLPILVQDLAESVWGFKACASYSLTGQKSPKTPNAERKPPAPQGDVQAILGFYRAKLMQEGLKVEAVLDTQVEKLGCGYLRSKFQNAAKKLMREETRAEIFAQEQVGKKEENQLV